MKKSGAKSEAQLESGKINSHGFYSSLVECLVRMHLSLIHCDFLPGWYGGGGAVAPMAVLAG